MACDPWRRDEGKVPDSRRPMAGAGGPLRLRDWLVAQIESGRYAGLRWEDAGKTLFRIPWKHAAKQGYRAQKDAALFRGEAPRKGLLVINSLTHSPLVAPPHPHPPTVWFLSLLLMPLIAKSKDAITVIFSDPWAWAIYKGKHLEGIDKEDPSTWKTRLRCALNKSADFCEVRERSQLDISNPYKVYRLMSSGANGPGTILPLETLSPDAQDGSRLATEDKNEKRPPRLAQQGSLPPAALLSGPLADHRYQAQEPAHPWDPLPSDDFSNPDCWLHVRLFYGAELRGVLLWVAPEGVFAKRLCQGRVYWRGPLAPHRARPNKLEREHTCQLLDTRRFLAELRAHLQDGRPEPEYQIRLCFGEEYPGPPDQPEERLIMAHVEPVFARELLLHSKRHGQLPQWRVPRPASPTASLTC
ncbi:Interferon regulatory factor 4 [Camelus dromedarius]|uniref:Interferon regulatory factor 4 n=1 Tax=Camelus dromedarius TaxID=9838 RepID=A0A5N4CVD9_CAMDR|nr:Interferon regulatory factor 4 [Camelus dromedarius]KAB1262821.1 Interferon regulatory factor 4 [Camelus dromedarius]